MCCPGDCEIDPDCEDFDINWPELTLSLSSPGCAILDGCTDTLSNGGSGYSWDEVNSICFGSFTFYRDVDNCWKVTGSASDCINFGEFAAISASCDPPSFHFVAYTSPESEFGCPECGGAQVDIYITG